MPETLTELNRDIAILFYVDISYFNKYCIEVNIRVNTSCYVDALKAEHDTPSCVLVEQSRRKRVYTLKKGSLNVYPYP